MENHIPTFDEFINEAVEAMLPGIKEFAGEERSEGSVVDIFLATFDGRSIQAQSTNKTWPDQTPITKFFTRGGYKGYKLKGNHYVIDSSRGWWYFKIDRNWFAVKKSDYETPPFEY
jgi:hypothetical protein